MTNVIRRSTQKHGKLPTQTAPGRTITWTHYLTSPLKQRHRWFPLTTWLPLYFIKRAVQLSISSKDAEDQLLEVSYLTLFVAVLLAGLALAIFVLLELYATFLPG